MATTTRRSVMRAFGEYLNFIAWLDDAKNGIDVEPGDMPVAQIAEAVNRFEVIYQDKIDEYLEARRATPNERNEL